MEGRWCCFAAQVYSLGNCFPSLPYCYCSRGGAAGAACSMEPVGSRKGDPSGSPMPYRVGGVGAHVSGCSCSCPVTALTPGIPELLGTWEAPFPCRFRSVCSSCVACPCSSCLLCSGTKLWTCSHSQAQVLLQPGWVMHTIRVVLTRQPPAISEPSRNSFWG